jgi:hypothetical protein
LMVSAQSNPQLFRILIFKQNVQMTGFFLARKGESDSAN